MACKAPGSPCQTVHPILKYLLHSQKLQGEPPSQFPEPTTTAPCTPQGLGGRRDMTRAVCTTGRERGLRVGMRSQSRKKGLNENGGRGTHPGGKTRGPLGCNSKEQGIMSTCYPKTPQKQGVTSRLSHRMRQGTNLVQLTPVQTPAPL